MTKIPKHYGEKDLSYLDTLFPWAEELPAEFRKSLK
jgi:hypothetical protein